MPGDTYPSIQNPKQYRALWRKGMSKQAAARISNAATPGHTVKALKYGAQYSASNLDALKACRTHLSNAHKALDLAGVPMADEEPEVKALSLGDISEMVCDAIMEMIDTEEDVPASALPFRIDMTRGEADDGEECDEPEIEVYPDFAILELGPGELYQIAYSLVDGAICASPPSAWVRVEEEYRPLRNAPTFADANPDMLSDEVAKAPTGAIKMLPDGRFRIGGVRYGTRDLVGDTFTTATDLGAARSFVGMPVYYDHAQRGIKSQIGQVVAYEDTGDGIDYIVELNRHQKYIDTVKRLYAAGALGGSTGAAPHLVVRENGTLKRWIIAELSLTPTPAEPTTIIGTQAQTKAAPEASTDAVSDEAARVLSHIYAISLAYRAKTRDAS